MTDEENRVNTINAVVQSLNEQVAEAAKEGLKVSIDVKTIAERVSFMPTRVSIPVIQVEVQIWKAL